jgi:hypothetical protein
MAALSAAGVTGGLIAWRDVGIVRADILIHHEELVRHRAMLDDIDGRCRTNTVSRERNERIIDRLEREVSELRNHPQARPDPFTGTEGRALRDRIERLEGAAGQNP